VYWACYVSVLLLLIRTSIKKPPIPPDRVDPRLVASTPDLLASTLDLLASTATLCFGQVNPSCRAWSHLGANPQKREGAQPSMSLDSLHPKKLFEICILRQPAGHASHRWPTSNLYFYTNMLPALGPLLHLEIISAAMGVANCIPRNERGLDLP
jgi:hypothetical protein